MRQLKWLLLFVVILWPASTVMAEGGPDQRVIYHDEACQVYWWDLMSFATSNSACRFGLYNPGPPTASEVRAFCGPDLSEAWYKTAQIPPDGQAPDTGFYTLLHHVEFTTCKTASHLAPVRFTHYISGNKLIISASEPIQDAAILTIDGYYGKHPFECVGGDCEIVILPTDGQGVKVWYRATTTATDDPTPREVLYIRHQRPDPPELIDSQHGSTAQRYWGSFPGHDPPGWLGPAEPTDVGLAYLAGRLIRSGEVDASQCGSGGLLFNGYADVCGLNAARPLLRVYQNQHDGAINQAAQAEGIPGKLLKKLIETESQFWAQAQAAAGEVGLGQLTHNGADMVLIWDADYYQQICQPLFGDECNFGYTRLDDWQRAALQNQVLEDPGIRTVARALAASAGQAGAIIRDITDQRPGVVLSHQDLWRAALANYHAGAGCLGAALREAKSAGYKLEWGSIGASLELFCPGAADYVESVTK
jgi:hypothetical protein